MAASQHPSVVMPQPIPTPLTLRASAFTLAALALALPAQAQVDAGQLLREAQQQQQRQAPQRVPAAKASDARPAVSGPTVIVKTFRIEGVRRYDEANLQAALAPLKDQPLDFGGLQRAADQVAEFYRRDGWHAGAFLPQQDLKDGVLRIVVVESSLGRVKLQGAEQLRANTPRAPVERYLARAVQPGQPLNLEALARATAVANELPGARVSTVLAAGEQPGQTDVLLRIDPRPQWAGSLSADNQDSASTGTAKVTAIVSLVSPLALGEVFDIIASKSQGKRFGRLSASMPVGTDGWRVSVAASALDYRLVGDAAVTAGSGAPNGAKGSASTFGATASYPLKRGESLNASLIVGADHRTTKNETLLGVTSDKRVDSGSLTLQADRTDGWMGGGASSASLVLTHGRLDISRVAADLSADQIGPRTQGSFTKWNLTASRLQRVTDEHLLYAGINAQFSPGNLDAGEKFSLGGPQGVRAYPLLEASGDDGVVATVAWRWILNGVLPGQFRLEAFVDAGWIRRTKTPYAGAQLPNEYQLQGAGLGADWSPMPQLRLSAQVADRIGGNPGALPNGRDGDGTRRRPRAWLSTTLNF